MGCYFCEKKQEPSYKQHEELASFVSSRSKIKARKRSGVCAKHQRRLAVQIKRARHLGLLPFR